MGEPVIIAESLPFISRSLLVTLARPRHETLRTAATLLWTTCEKLRLGSDTYATALLYLQRLLVLNPQLLDKVGREDQDLREASCACLVTAFLTEGVAKKIDDAATVMEVEPARVIAMQREVLETNAFDFRVQTAPQWVVRIIKTLDLDRSMGYRAFLAALDACETSAILQFPAHHVAAACIDVVMREERGAGNKERPLMHWDLDRFSLKIVAIRTTCRLLLEFYERCDREGFATHASLRQSNELRSWLLSLKKSVPGVEPVSIPLTRDPTVSKEGTARFRARRRRLEWGFYSSEDKSRKKHPKLA